MRVFVDTNVIIEAMLNRQNSHVAQSALDLLAAKRMAAYISSPSFCTMIYLLEQGFKEMRMFNPARLECMRERLNTILDCFRVIDLPSTALRQGVNDTGFADLEDACQYQAAKRAKCDVLVTFNVSDFRNSSGDVLIMTPSIFISHYN